jgi:transposase
MAKRNQATAEAIEQPVAELQAQLKQEPVVNVDETGHKDPSLRRSVWTWVFATPAFTTFKLAASRGSKVLVEVLGKKFKGTVICDFFSAYRKFDGLSQVQLQLCWAHLIREWKALLEDHRDAARRYALRVLSAIKRMFRWVHRREGLDAGDYQRELQAKWQAVLDAARWPPHYGDARKLADRLRTRAHQYGRFVEELAVEPTNNFGERQLRPVVIDRRITQGTRSAAGRTWCERIWTAAATCAQQGRSLFDYLCAAIAANHHGRSAPSLLPV